MNVGDQVRKRLVEIDERLPSDEAELERLTASVREMRAERRQLVGVVRQLEGRRNGGPAVTDEQVVEAFKELKQFDVPSGVVAEHLGVTKRNVARKLRKLVDDGVLTGDVERGYSLTAAAG